MFKYNNEQINWGELKKHSIKHVIDCEIVVENILLDINFNSEGGFGWIEGEGMLPDLLPIYEEIKSGDYGFLRLVASLDNDGEKPTDHVLSEAQETFIKYAEAG
ncbi:MAG: hypothetical protein ACD_45C00643G0005 [uncultured bacterium]|nr:MAG: hypothetical protein ACD_45C00643G0005 [uncultured bacterium]